MIQQKYLEYTLAKLIKQIQNRLAQSDFFLTANSKSTLSVKFHDFLIKTQHLTTMTLRMDNHEVEVKMKGFRCPYCTSVKSGFNRILAHLFSSHSDTHLEREYKFSYDTTQKRIIVELTDLGVQRQKRRIVDDQPFFCNDVGYQHYLILVTDHLTRCLNEKRFFFSVKNRVILKLEDQIQQLISTKRFFHGPSRHFQPIYTVREFLENSDDENYANFENTNEMLSVGYDVQEIDLLKQEFIGIWNQCVMKLKSDRNFAPTNQKDAPILIQDLIARLGDMKKYHIPMMEHLAALLSYQIIDPNQFVEIVEKL